MKHNRGVKRRVTQKRQQSTVSSLRTHKTSALQFISNVKQSHTTAQVVHTQQRAITRSAYSGSRTASSVVSRRSFTSSSFSSPADLHSQDIHTSQRGEQEQLMGYINHDPDDGIPCNYIEFPGNKNIAPAVKPYSVISFTDHLSPSLNYEELKNSLQHYVEINGRVIKIFPGYETTVLETISEQSQTHRIDPADFSLILPVSAYECQSGQFSKAHPALPHVFSQQDRDDQLRKHCPHYVPHRRGYFSHKVMHDLTLRLDSINMNKALGLPTEDLYDSEFDLGKDVQLRTQPPLRLTRQPASSTSTDTQDPVDSSSDDTTATTVAMKDKSKNDIVTLNLSDILQFDSRGSQQLPAGVEPKKDPFGQISLPAGRYFGDRLNDKVHQVTNHLATESVDVVLITELQHISTSHAREIFDVLLESFFQCELLVLDGRTRGYGLSSDALSNPFYSEEFLSLHKVMMIANFASELARMHRGIPTRDPLFHPQQYDMLMDLCAGVYVPPGVVVDDLDDTHMSPHPSTGKPSQSTNKDARTELLASLRTGLGGSPQSSAHTASSQGSADSSIASLRHGLGIAEMVGSTSTSSDQNGRTSSSTHEPLRLSKFISSIPSFDDLTKLYDTLDTPSLVTEALSRTVVPEVAEKAIPSMDNILHTTLQKAVQAKTRAEIAQQQGTYHLLDDPFKDKQFRFQQIESNTKTDQQKLLASGTEATPASESGSSQSEGDASAPTALDSNDSNGTSKTQPTPETNGHETKQTSPTVVEVHHPHGNGSEGSSGGPHQVPTTDLLKPLAISPTRLVDAGKQYYDAQGNAISTKTFNPYHSRSSYENVQSKFAEFQLAKDLQKVFPNENVLDFAKASIQEFQEMQDFISQLAARRKAVTVVDGFVHLATHYQRLTPAAQQEFIQRYNKGVSETRQRLTDHFQSLRVSLAEEENTLREETSPSAEINERLYAIQKQIQSIDAMLHKHLHTNIALQPFDDIMLDRIQRVDSTSIKNWHDWKRNDFKRQIRSTLGVAMRQEYTSLMHYLLDPLQHSLNTDDKTGQLSGEHKETVLSSDLTVKDIFNLDMSAIPSALHSNSQQQGGDGSNTAITADDLQLRLRQGDNELLPFLTTFSTTGVLPITPSSRVLSTQALAESAINNLVPDVFEVFPVVDKLFRAEPLTKDEAFTNEEYIPMWMQNRRRNRLLHIETEVNVLNHTFTTERLYPKPPKQKKALDSIEQYRSKMQLITGHNYALTHGLVVSTTNTFSLPVDGHRVRVVEGPLASPGQQQYLSETMSHSFSFLRTLERAYPFISKDSNLKGLPPLFAVSTAQLLQMQLPNILTPHNGEHVLYTQLLPSVQGAINVLQHIPLMRTFAEQLATAVEKLKSTTEASLIAWNSPMVHEYQQQLSALNMSLRVLDSASQQTLWLVSSLGFDSVGIPRSDVCEKFVTYIRRINLRSNPTIDQNENNHVFDQDITRLDVLERQEALRIMGIVQMQVIPLMKKRLQELQSWLLSSPYFKQLEGQVTTNRQMQINAFGPAEQAMLEGSIITPEQNQLLITQYSLTHNLPERGKF